VRAVALAAGAALVLAASAPAGSHPNAAAIETKLVCPVCHETLDQSTAPVAQEMKVEIRKRIAQGWTEKQILDEMVANFGPGVLSTPSKHGFDLLAWVLPIGGAAAGVIALGVGARYWTRAPAGPAPPESPALDPEMEQRIDDELDRFDG
jgi:cytochrome c-type biogenesis protein CcmH